MKTTSIPRSLMRSFAPALLLCGPLAVTALAESSFLTAWTARYPSSTLPQRMLTLTGSRCNVCHEPPNRGTQGTCYKNRIRDLMNQGSSIQQAINTADAEDSDGDGVANGVEITTQRADNAAQIGYHPGLIGDLGTSPCGPDTNVAVTHQSETPTLCAVDFDGDGFVTGVDFDLYVAAFESGDIAADFDRDGFITGVDFDLFVQAFEAGC